LGISCKSKTGEFEPTHELMLGPCVTALGGLALGVVAVRHEFDEEAEEFDEEAEEFDEEAEEFDEEAEEFDEEAEEFVVEIWFGVEKLYVCVEDGKKEDLGRKARRSGDMVSNI
jgi:hypothetical protein